MSSPFPGMDPYLEDPAIWPDFHVTFIVALRADLNAHLSARYNALADRHVGFRDRGKGPPFLKIIDTQERRVITAIELLSPTNKTSGPDRNSYLEKREEYFAAGVNLVEINLLRSGKNPPLGDLSSKDYYILVCKAKDLPQATLWSFTVRQPFPEVFVPLRSQETVTVNLRPSLDRAYQEARYDGEIDYAKPPRPPLSKEDAHWAKSILPPKSHKTNSP